MEYRSSQNIFILRNCIYITDIIVIVILTFIFKTFRLLIKKSMDTSNVQKVSNCINTPSSHTFRYYYYYYYYYY
jgi:hypothetical protein